MRVTAIVLTMLAALVCLWTFALAEMLIRPPADGAMQDTYYVVAHARALLPCALLALLNGALALSNLQRPRRGALWLVLAGGFLALLVPALDFAVTTFGLPAPTYFFDASAGGDEPFKWLHLWLGARPWLVWTALALTLAGWGAWLVNRRISAAQTHD